MIAIKDMEMPSACVTTIKFKGKVVSNMKCPLYYSCAHKDVYNVDIKPEDCPLVEIIEGRDIIIKPKDDTVGAILKAILDKYVLMEYGEGADNDEH